jgi:acyl-CoA dehydrogenase
VKGEAMAAAGDGPGGETDSELKLLAETCDALMRERGDSRDGTWDEQLWQELEQAGITLISVPEASGGSGGSLAQAAVALGAAGRHAARVPLAETSLLGGWLLAEAGLPIPAGPLVAVRAAAGETDGFSVVRVADGWRARGRLPRVGWGRVAERVVVLAAADGAEMVVVLRPGDFTIEPGANVAGEPRDHLTVDTVVGQGGVVAVEAGGGSVLRRRAALARVLLIAGTLDRVLELTIRYAGEREQFGRPLSNFQAIQQQIAELAAETAAVRAAADAALFQCAEDGFADRSAGFAVAAAKVQAARGATAAARIAHQVHGAIGFTEEHALRLSTTRLWAWRDEAGDPADWAAEIGQQVLADDTSAWRAITQES